MAEKVRNKSGLLDKIFKVLFNIVIFFVCLIAFVLVIYVFSAQIHKNDKGYKPFISFYTIVSPSMNPVIKVYDVVVNTKVNNPEDIEVGDIITYISTNSTSEGMTITHRVVAITKADNGSYEYQTQGDNNSEPDGVLVTFDNVIGKEVMIIPKLGRIQFLLANKKGWFMLLLIPILVFVFKDVYDLIELFGLRRKVDDVAGYVEEPVRVKKKSTVEAQQKEILKRELSIHNTRSDALERKSSEGEGFLEPYSETIVEIGKPIVVKKKIESDVEPIKIVKADKIEGKEIVPNTDDVEVNKKIEEIKPILSPIEILDTDELTSKIKAYDQKISKLNEMLMDLERMKVDKEKEIVVEKEKLTKEIAKEKEEARIEIEKEKNVAKEEIENMKQASIKEEKKDAKKEAKKIVDNYLIGRKIKVVNTVETKKKRNKKAVKEDSKIVLGKKDENINTRLVIERPKAEDLPKIRESEKVVEEVKEEKKKPTTIIDNRELNLKDNKVSKKKKKLSSADIVLKELNTLNKKEDTDLLFNPKMVKKVEANRSDTSVTKKEKKKGFIYIVKEKKDKK